MSESTAAEQSATQTVAAEDARPSDSPADVARPLSLTELFRQNRGRILFTYGLFNLENLIRLAQPWALGLAIHDLLANSYRGMGVFFAQQIAYSVSAASRRMYDTRCFRRIYADLVSRIVPEQRRRQVEVSRVAARSVLAREIVDFFERDVPHVVFSLYSVVGATVLLAWYDPVLMLLCFGMLPVTWWLSRGYGRKTALANAELHDRLEGEVQVVERGCPEETKEHYSRVGESLIKLSDLEAGNFTRQQVFIFALTAAALLRVCRDPAADIGSIFAVFGYVMMFVGGLATLPYLVQRLHRLGDIRRRLAVEG